MYFMDLWIFIKYQTEKSWHIIFLIIGHCYAFIDAKLSHISQREVSLDNRKLRRWIVTKLQPGQYHHQ